MTFEEVISYESLYRAHRRARLGKRHKKEVIAFEMHISENLWQMHYELLYGKYKVGSYYRFMIYDPKEREVQAIGYRDRILQHALCDGYLSPLLEKKLIYYNVACQKEKGTSLAVKALRRFMTEHYKKHGNTGYFVKADIKKYFDSIDHALLKEKLLAIVQDRRLFLLLEAIIDSYHGDTGKGLPLGNQTSQNFALLYLDALDKRLTCTLGAHRYVRYMDDIILLTPNRETAVLRLSQLYTEVEKNSLSLHTKSQIIAVKNGVSFLGWHFFYGTNGAIVQTVKKASRKRMKKHFKKSAAQKSTDISCMQASYRGYLLHGNGYRFFQSLLDSLQSRSYMSLPAVQLCSMRPV